MKLLVVWLHVLGVVVWFGALLYQAHVLMPMARRGQVGTFVEAARRQRPVSWVALALVVLTGFYNVTRLGPLERVLEGGAGLFLAGKFMLVVLVIPLTATRDFTHLVRLQLALQTNEDPTRPLKAITWLDRVAILLALAITYLGLAISRS